MPKLLPGEYVAPSPGLAKPTTCRACRARIVFVESGGSKIPLGLATRRSIGEYRWAMRNHFEECPGRDRMRRRKGSSPVARARAETAPREQQRQLF